MSCYVPEKTKRWWWGGERGALSWALLEVQKVWKKSSALTSERNKQKRNINRSIILMVICSVMCGWGEEWKMEKETNLFWRFLRLQNDEVYWIFQTAETSAHFSSTFRIQRFKEFIARETQTFFLSTPLNVNAQTFSFSLPPKWM